jgi:hypothetical protein
MGMPQRRGHACMPPKASEVFQGFLQCKKIQALETFPLQTIKNIFFEQSSEKCVFLTEKILQVLRLKNEHYSYMFRTPIIPVKILRNPVYFFNGGFT